MMTVRTNAASKEQLQQTIIERFGVKIGNAEWEEILNYYSYWTTEVSRMTAYFDEKNQKLPEKYREIIDRQSLFFSVVRNVYKYMYTMQSKMSDFSGELAEFWIINPFPAAYLVSYDGVNIHNYTASFQELMSFLALGVARRCWSIEDAMDKIVTECRSSKLIAVN